MKSSITAILLALFVGAAAAFFRPAVPYQVEAPVNPAIFPRGGASFDAGLDNPEIEADQNIEPARKCGFCMGVSNELSYFCT